MNRRQKILTMQNQLKEQGIRLNFLETTYNKNLNIECNVEDYRRAFSDVDLQQMCSRYVWENLPPELTSWQIEQMLYFRGALAGYIRGGTLYLLPFTMTDGVNIYGFPNAVKPITYNGAEAGTETNLKLIVNNKGEPTNTGGAIILYDRIPLYSSGNPPIARAVLNRQMVDLEADIMGRIENNLATASLKLIFECENEKQANQVEKDVRANLQSGKPYLIIRKDSLSERDGTPYQEGVKLETQTLIELLQSVISLRCGMGGIRNGGAFEKKERAITSEMESDSIQSDLIADSGLEMRKLWLAQMKLAYPEYAGKLAPINVTYAQATRRAYRAIEQNLTMNGATEQ